MLSRLRDIIIGPPLPTGELGERKLNKIRALAAFSPDALSSIAYANQEIYLALAVAGAAGLSLSFSIALVITGLLVILALSYFQTISAYPSGGGSYTVAKENLGKLPGLATAAALMIDYTLTAAVSLTAGVAAVASAFPVLWSYRVEAALLLLLVLTLANLRGMRETGTLMSIPVYLFLFTYLPMLVYGFVQLQFFPPGSLPAAAPVGAAPLTLLLVAHAFSTGCTALTGIEAISNGVPAFRPPATRNAEKTLVVMALLMGLLFIGSIGLTQQMAITAGPQETILSALARRILGSGPAYVLVQVTTTAILAVAANTSFSGFPRLSAILANEGFLPRQFKSLGDRLVYANGIVFLAGMTGILILVFKGDSHLLIPLFAVGVFLAFTLSQAGMVVHWKRKGGRGWLLKAMLNGLGAVATLATLLVVGASKFMDGAWVTILVIPIIVAVFYKIKSHYDETRHQLSLSGVRPLIKPLPAQRIVMPVAGIHRGTVEALNFCRSISDQITVVFLELEPGEGEAIRDKWEKWFPDVPLDIVSSPYRSIVGPLLDYLDRVDQQYHDGRQAVLVLPELVTAKWWQNLLHNQTALVIKAALLYKRRKSGFQRVIIDVPFHLKG